jgi:NAD(P)-dependent dehydrogenase (short-subunit alcohol dehydrogenase family)
MNPMNPERVVILGGTSGIGLAAAQALSKRGFEVIATGRNPERANRVRAENPQITVELADAASAQALQPLFARIQRFDHLVLCVSGGKGAGPLASLSMDELRQGFELKFFPQVQAAKLAIPHLRRDGSLTFVTAISARAANPNTAGLAAINGALEAMVKPLARELKPLRVNAVSPGVVETPWWDNLAPDVRERLLQQAAAASLVGRNASPAEPAQAIEFVVTNGFVNGTVIEIDGGLRLN